MMSAIDLTSGKFLSGFCRSRTNHNLFNKDDALPGTQLRRVELGYTRASMSSRVSIGREADEAKEAAQRLRDRLDAARNIFENENKAEVRNRLFGSTRGEVDEKTAGMADKLLAAADNPRGWRR